MKPDLSAEDISLYLQHVVTVETPRAGRDGLLLFRCPVRSQPPHDISMNSQTGQWLCLGGTCGRGRSSASHAARVTRRSLRPGRTGVHLSGRLPRLPRLLARSPGRASAGERSGAVSAFDQLVITCKGYSAPASLCNARAHTIT